TSHSICRENVIEHNGLEGISIGERDTDHLIEANEIRDNGRSGIGFREPQIEGADRVIVRRNTLADNAAATDHRQLQIASRINDIYILDNIFSSPSDKPVAVGAECTRVALAGNRVGDEALEPRHVESAESAGSDIQWTKP